MKRSMIGLTLICVGLITSGAICAVLGNNLMPYANLLTVLTDVETTTVVVDAFQAKYPISTLQSKPFGWKNTKTN